MTQESTQPETMKLSSDDVQEAQKHIAHVKQEVGKVIIGQEKLVERMLIALLAQGHILLEGVPGLAKTTAIATLAQTLEMDFKRIQFTPDLLPSDLIGSRVYERTTGSFSINKGPVFANFVLADEINRSPAKVQSALLESMQERQVTIGDQTMPLPQPFLVMATENPIEQEGTYPLPEAQVDRFLMKTIITYPSYEEELAIMRQHGGHAKSSLNKVLDAEMVLGLQEMTDNIFVDESIEKYIADIVFLSRDTKKLKKENIDKLIAYGASPRASLGFLQAARALALVRGRAYVIPEDIKELAPDILRHRIIPTYEAEAERVDSDQIIEMILSQVRVP